MQKTTLQFNTLFDLVKFQAAIQMASYRINTSAVSLTGNFSEEEVHIATNHFQARRLKAEPSLQKQESF